MALSTNKVASHGISAELLARMRLREEERFIAAHPRSQALHNKALRHMPHGVPLHWMSQWGSPYPIFAERAVGARLTDVDGHSYVDFCLGDSASLFGHANPVVASVIAHELTERGATYMLPTEDAAIVTRMLASLFGLPYWQVAVSASDANRFALRIARLITGRDKVLVFNGKFHGTVDETQVELRDGRLVPQHDISPNGLDLERLAKVIEFNDLAALEAALAPRDVALVMTEPHMTNIGMVPAEPGFHKALRKLTRNTGTLLLIDETHTIAMGPKGGTGQLGLDPDMLVLGKVLAGGIPSAVYGMNADIGAAVERITAGPGINHYGFGGTLAANALTLRAMRATLENLLTEATYRPMIALATELERRIAERLRAASLPWHVMRFGARVEYLYRPTPPRNGGEAGAARDDAIELLSHLYFANRGVLLTPFHNMALISPATTQADVERYDAVFGDMLAEFTSH
jgi:glutamate-1-semialdehyde 2,1-aminomutase